MRKENKEGRIGDCVALCVGEPYVACMCGQMLWHCCGDSMVR